MVGGGAYNLQPGQWTDDTSMALCLAESLLAMNGFNAGDQMLRYVNWWVRGHLSSTGECFGMGRTVNSALQRYLHTNKPFSGSSEPCTAGNGSLMRLAPVALYFHPDEKQVLQHCAESSRTTHAAPEAIECCSVLGAVIGRCLAGVAKDAVCDVSDLSLLEPKVSEIARSGYATKAAQEILGTGYAVASLEAALWCFTTTSSFEEAILKAANLGDDADTTAAITGQIAGAFYGEEGIPNHWLDRLHMHDDIRAMADALYHAASAR
jgi:ADP-ribosyl-[dinitrogen reductase] hydrolase